MARVVIAAPASGHGKTTVATGLMAALREAGHVVSGHKVGPDYIDPGYHALATGRPGRNLDPHLVGEARLEPLFLHGAAGADLAIIEGVMGLYDGALGRDGFASTAHVAAVLRAPVILVVDISHASRSIAAVVHGMATFDPSVHIAGVILNKAGSERHAREVTDALQATGVEVLGVLSRDDGIVAPSRHLGLVPAQERPSAVHELGQLAAQVRERVDLEAVVRIARSAGALAGDAWSPGPDTLASLGGSTSGDPVVAVAGGRAFTFRYAETEELLRAHGCEPVVFDPTTDTSLPEGTQGIYLGGGFPEVHAADLSANEPMRTALAEAIAAGVPTVAECAGLLYLCTTLDDAPMIGAIDATAAMTPKLTLAYRTAIAPSDSLLTRAGERVTGHEFHRTAVSDIESPAWLLDGRSDGFGGPTLHASYLHTHWAGHPQLAARFAEAVHAWTP
ncbi:MAG TPA: cobyrinate a,c-diamide synthase [Nocardioidaceae bacterium]|nr:cobyrinate a,c-diamide synthase [Nocardioidaceae bacterium]